MNRRINYILEVAAVMVAAWLYGPAAKAQIMEESVPQGIQAAVDSTLYGFNIVDILPSKSRGNAGDIHLHQSSSVAASLASYINRNVSRPHTGYRVRIFFDNKQNSRVASQKAMNKFYEICYGIPAYRTYQSPFFKVTVGDFRTKSEAMMLLHALKPTFPAAFIVKENIEYPAADRELQHMIESVENAELPDSSGTAAPLIL